MTIIADQTFGLDADGLRDLIAGDVYTPQDAGWDEARQAWNLAADQRPARSCLPNPPPTWRPPCGSPASTGCASPRRAPAKRRSARARSRATICCSRPSACAASRSTPQRRHRPRRGRRALGGGRPAPPPSTAWPRSPAPRPTSAWSATRSAAASAGSPASTASPPTASGASRSSPPTAALRARRRRPRARPVLGAPRRRRQLRRRHRARVRACSAIAEVYAGVLFFPMERGARGAARLARVARRPLPDERHDGRPAACSSRRSPRSPSRCAASRSRSSRRPRRRRGRGRRVARAAARAGPGIDTFATVPAAGAQRTAHGPRAPGARRERRHAARRAAGRGGRRSGRRRPALTRARRCCRSSSGSWAAPSAGPRRPAVRSAPSTRRLRCSPSEWRSTRPCRPPSAATSTWSSAA